MARTTLARGGHDCGRINLQIIAEGEGPKTLRQPILWYAHRIWVYGTYEVDLIRELQALKIFPRGGICSMQQGLCVPFARAAYTSPVIS